MGYLEDISTRLLETTMPARTAPEALTSLATGFSPSLQTGIAPLKKSEQVDIITHEYAVDPFRIQLALNSGVSEYSDIAQQVKNKRDELLSFKKPLTLTTKDKEKISKLRSQLNKIAVPATFKLEKGKNVGEYLKEQGQNWKDFYYKINGEWRPADKVKFETETKDIQEMVHKLDLDNIKKRDKLIEQISIMTEGTEGKTAAQLRKEIRDLTNRFNKIVPGRSELMQLRGIGVHGGEISVPKYPYGIKPDKEYDLKFRSVDKAISGYGKDVQGNYLNIYANPEGQRYIEALKSAHHDMLISLKPVGAILDRVTGTRNTVVNFLNDLSRGEILPKIKKMQLADIGNKMIEIRKYENDPALQKLMIYQLIADNARMGADPKKSFISYLSSYLAKDVLDKNNAIDPTLYGDPTFISRYADDLYATINNFTDFDKNANNQIEETGKSIYDALYNNLSKESKVAKDVLKEGNIFTLGLKIFKASPDEAIKNILTEITTGRLSLFAPKTEEAIRNPNEQEKMYMDIFENVTGFNFTMGDVKKLEQTHIKKKVDAYKGKLRKDIYRKTVVPFN